MDVIKTGIDLIEISRLHELNPNIRERFITRVYTPDEIAYCADSYESLACRFAAKEAVSKALGCGIGQIKWQDIEILNDELGEPQVNLYGNAKRFAENQGLTEWALSLSHTKSYATAIAIAYGSKQ
jgi:holo-[acyl-carrier protein] synthase